MIVDYGAFSKSVERYESLSRNYDLNMTQTLHVYAICSEPDVAGDVISSENVKTIRGYLLVYFEIAR